MPEQEERLKTWARSCVRKKRYASSAFALHLVEQIKAKRGATLRPYYCKLCAGYHLTSRAAR